MSESTGVNDLYATELKRSDTLRGLVDTVVSHLKCLVYKYVVSEKGIYIRTPGGDPLADSCGANDATNISY